jgi:ABC-2 type transport system ATP-binding protein
MLEVQNLSKTFDNTQALNDVSFKVNPGEVFALLGPNGAGKTTAMRLLMQILKPDEGEILYKNIPRAKLKRNLFGYLPEERGLYQRSKVLDLLVYVGVLNRLSHHRAEIEAIRYLDKLGLVDYTQKRVCELSKGMQQKIQFILAMIHNPEILILDEPFAGLDPVNQMVLRDIVKENKSEGKVIILSTHQMSEVELMADHLMLLNQGGSILEGTLEEIKSRFKENAFYLEAENNIGLMKELKEIKIIEEHNNSCKFAINIKENSKEKILQTIFQKISVKKFIEQEPSLNEIFIKLVQAGSGKNAKKP